MSVVGWFGSSLAHRRTNKEKLQTGVFSQTDSEIYIIITGIIDGMTSNNPSGKIVTRYIIFKNLERANPELASQEGPYMRS